MTGWNLPPGCEVHHIPGNRPEDLEDEAFWGAIEIKLSETQPTHLTEAQKVWDEDWFITTINAVRDIAFTEGFYRGREETAEAMAEEARNRQEWEEEQAARRYKP
jgi:hypothetical protein